MKEARRESSTISSVLARKLHTAILNGELAVGTSLPSERELMEKYRCSRATVREALLNLRAQDMIVVKRGRTGGSFIAAPSSRAVVRSLDQFIRGQQFRFIDLVAAREAIEPAAAAQAAVAGNQEKIEALRAASVVCEESVNDRESFVEANLAWHLALAEASDNPLFVAFLTSISKATHSATEFEEFDLTVRQAVVAIHWQIYEAIRKGDADAARRRTARHIDAYTKKLTSIA